MQAGLEARTQQSVKARNRHVVRTLAFPHILTRLSAECLGLPRFWAWTVSFCALLKKMCMWCHMASKQYSEA